MFFFYDVDMKSVFAVLLISFHVFAVDKSNDKNITLKRSQVKKKDQVESILVSKVVGTAADQVVTSREVQIVNFLEKALVSDKNLNLIANDDSRFNVEVAQVLLEIVVQTESNVFEFSQMSDEEFKEALDKVQKNLTQAKEWKTLQASAAENEKFLKRKMIS